MKIRLDLPEKIDDLIEQIETHDQKPHIEPAMDHMITGHDDHRKVGQVHDQAAYLHHDLISSVNSHFLPIDHMIQRFPLLAQKGKKAVGLIFLMGIHIRCNGHKIFLLLF